MEYITPLAPAYAEIFLLCMICVILLPFVIGRRCAISMFDAADLLGCL
jgi:hypothetical protein